MLVKSVSIGCLELQRFMQVIERCSKKNSEKNSICKQEIIGRVLFGLLFITFLASFDFSGHDRQNCQLQVQASKSRT